MAVLIDHCRRAQFSLWAIFIMLFDIIICSWVTPAALYLTPGWHLRFRRVSFSFCFTLIGLSQLYTRLRHATSMSHAIFGLSDCPPERAQYIYSLTWTVCLQFLSAALWSPLSWCSRRLSTPTSFLLLKLAKLLFLVPLQLFRAAVWAFAALFIAVFWFFSTFIAPPLNILIIPFALFTSATFLWFLFLYVSIDLRHFPPGLRLAVAETTVLMRQSFTKLHMLQVFANLATTLSIFGCRDRWFRRDALNAPIGHAVRATLPGLIGPISTLETDLGEAVAALRGLRNKWRDMEQKEFFLDDPDTLVYTLSYKHIPVLEHGEMIRLHYDRALRILEQVMNLAKSHGYERFMLWCDGASVAGVRTDRAWVDIGLLPYTVYRTVRVETRVNGELLTADRLWLALERDLSSLTCGMDVISECIDDSGARYSVEDKVDGQGYKAMVSILRVSSRIAQGQFNMCAASREEDRTDIARWARRMLIRSGVKEMNQALGWSGEPAGDRRAKAVLLRVTTFSLRTDDDGVSAEVVELRGNEKQVGRTEVRNAVETGRTEYWLKLLGFTEEEIKSLENEDLEFLTVRFEELRTGTWEMHTVNLQGNFFAFMTLFVNTESRSAEMDKDDSGRHWLVTNSQVENDTDVDDWVNKIIAEMFQARGLEYELVKIEHESEKSSLVDNPVAWFSDLLQEMGDLHRLWMGRLAEGGDSPKSRGGNCAGKVMEGACAKKL